MSSSTFSSAYVNDGHTVTVASLPYDRSGGQGVLVGAALFGVAAKDALSGTTCPVIRVGRFNLTKLSTDAVTAGALLYWDNTNKRLTLTATSNKLVGVAAADAASGVATVDVVLTGQVS